MFTFPSIRRFVFLFFVLSIPLSAAEMPERVVVVAAAADLQYALPELTKRYELSHPGQKISPTFGASGKFYEQMKQGAPFDLFLSADAAFPRKLIEAGLGQEADFFLYAIGHLVVWTPKTSPLDVEKSGIQILLDPSIQHIAIAKPETAPYGRAAKAALEKLGLYAKIQDRLVYGDNISQTAQFIETGAADVGLIALSLALGEKMRAEGKYCEVPLDAFPRLEQGGLVLPGGKNASGAREFKTWLSGADAKAILLRYGFALPE